MINKMMKKMKMRVRMILTWRPWSATAMTKTMETIAAMIWRGTWVNLVKCWFLHDMMRFIINESFESEDWENFYQGITPLVPAGKNRCMAEQQENYQGRKMCWGLWLPLILLQSELFVCCKILPQLNEEDVDSAHGTEQQRLDCDWKAQEDCHLVGFNGWTF